jgi:S-adenosylmethionine-diacylgycerolhomoserine-N-methlytransferase
MSAPTTPAAARMDQIYRYQRFVYDASRHYFLLGRDTLVAGLVPPEGGTVVEVGCGTARNLIETARTYPSVKLYGFDISSVMLATARKKITAAGLGDRITVAQGDAADFDLGHVFGIAGADRIMVSYALSMIPRWRDVVTCAGRQLAPGGSLHIVDFGQLSGFPPLAKAGLYRWLAKFSVHPSADLERDLRVAATTQGLDAHIDHPFRGYATYAVLKRR